MDFAKQNPEGYTYLRGASTCLSSLAAETDPSVKNMIRTYLRECIVVALITPSLMNEKYDSHVFTGHTSNPSFSAKAKPCWDSHVFTGHITSKRVASNASVVLDSHVFTGHIGKIEQFFKPFHLAFR